MCFGGPSAPPAAAQQVASPPPPPAQQQPRAPEIDPASRNARENASTTRDGTAIFRNDLSIPTASAVGTGLNIPTGKA